MVEEVFAQTICGEGTHSVTENGILTCVLDNPPATQTATQTASGTYSGLFPTLDFSNPDAIQESVSQTLLPNLINMDKLGNVAEASPIVFDVLVWLTSLSGIIPLSIGAIVGSILLYKKMKYNKKVDSQKIFQQDKKKFSLPKFPKFKVPKVKVNTNLMKKKLLPTEPYGAEDDKVFERYEDYLKKEQEKIEAEKTANDFHDSLAEEGITPDEIQQEIESKERDLDVITDPKEYVETAQEIEEMVEDKKEVEKEIETGGFLLPEDLDTPRTEVKEPEKMSLDDLEREIKESEHEVKIKDDEIEITEKPEVTVVEKPSEEQMVKNAINESSEIMGDELDTVLEVDNDFDPTPEKIQEAQEHFEQPDPTEEEIAEVQKLVKEGMSQDDAINQVVKNAQEKRSIMVEEKMTEEEVEIRDMVDARDVFTLDDPKKKKSKLQTKLEKTPFGKKVFAKKNNKALDIITNRKTVPVLTELGHKRMIEYAGKIEDDLKKWSADNNLNPKAQADLKSFSLFASMCEMLADKKTTKKRYWTRIKKDEIQAS